jgi:hypothetical protein
VSRKDSADRHYFTMIGFCCLNGSVGCLVPHPLEPMGRRRLAPIAKCGSPHSFQAAGWYSFVCELLAATGRIAVRPNGGEMARGRAKLVYSLFSRIKFEMRTFYFAIVATALLIGRAFAGAAFLCLMLVATSSVCFAQSVMPTGTRQLNLAKSKFAGPALKSITEYNEGERQNRTITIVKIDAAGNPFGLLYSEAAEDGEPHPVTGSPTTPAYDALSATPIDAYSLNMSRIKAAKVIQTGTVVVSRGGKSPLIPSRKPAGMGSGLKTFLFLISRRS